MPTKRMPSSSKKLLLEVRACMLCAETLKDGIRPVFQVHPNARILIAGQAPGSKVHATGIPFDDPSGERLRQWMGIDRTIFYDENQIAIVPMGLCYPGKGTAGDRPPAPICADTWRKKLLGTMPDIQLTLAIGQYAHAWHLPHSKMNVTDTVKAWASYGDHTIPLPHPSPRNNIWLKRNLWFESTVVPRLRTRVSDVLTLGATTE